MFPNNKNEKEEEVKQMLNQKLVFEELKKYGVSFYTGVPDSYLNGFCSYILKNEADNNIIAANEGNAVGIASGYFFATKNIPLVYMQNSGMGNALNPIVSLADKTVYSVPILFLIGWRGQPDTNDHPQHILQGKITTELLDILNIPYTILKDDIVDFKNNLAVAINYCNTYRQSYALIAPKGVMAEKAKANEISSTYEMSREEAINTILDCLPSDSIYSATTGRATRELYYLRERRGEPKTNDFLNVGSMGHASSVALGIAIKTPNRKVVVLDGDSAAIMHMGALSMTVNHQLSNYMHIVLNNGAHESVGGQPSVGHLIDFTSIAKACGYKTIDKPITTRDELIEAINVLKGCGKPSFIDCRIHKGLSRRLPPISFSHREAIDGLIKSLEK